MKRLRAYHGVAAVPTLHAGNLDLGGRRGGHREEDLGEIFVSDEKRKLEAEMKTCAEFPNNSGDRNENEPIMRWL